MEPNLAYFFFFIFTRRQYSILHQHFLLLLNLDFGLNTHMMSEIHKLTKSQVQ